MPDSNARAPHLVRPHTRPVQPIPVQNDGKQLVALRDPSMLVQQTMVVPPQAMGVIQLFNGESTVDEIASKLVREDDPERASNLEKAAVQVNALVDQMDKFGLLWGPTFEEYERQIATKLKENDAFPARASMSIVQVAHQASGGGEPPEAPEEQAAWARELATGQLDAWLADAEDPEFDQSVVGLVVPHLDYPRGAEVYAGGYRAWLGSETPDRVVILGTNHFGLGDGVVMSPHGFETPLGRVLPDTAVIEGLRGRLGDRLFKDQLDLLPEHSIELQLPWIRHLFGEVPVVAALLPDPLVPMIENDGGRVGLDEFVKALQESLGEAGGTTFFVSSADLSHVGPQFGEPKPVDEARRVEVERHDREHLAKFIANDVDAFVESMEWCKNPTRWCSLGNMSATARLAGASEIELVDYRQAVDDRGAALVSVAAIALLGD
ncbi:MAG: AmmeMemoRadiSam system protein B [Planctomycetota bacterium]|nr:AmmeMemoRadiSam system protein B [Planctomycetota bacterium]